MCAYVDARCSRLCAVASMGFRTINPALKYVGCHLRALPSNLPESGASHKVDLSHLRLQACVYINGHNLPFVNTMVSKRTYGTSGSCNSTESREIHSKVAKQTSYELSAKSDLCADSVLV